LIKEEDPKSDLEDEEVGTNPNPSRRLFGFHISKSKPGDESDHSNVVDESNNKGTNGEIKSVNKITSVQNPSNGEVEQSFLGFIVPYEVHERYSEAPTRCLASKIKKPFGRCNQGKKLSYPSLPNFDKYYQEKKYDDLLRLIKDFAKNALCNQHCTTANHEQRMGVLEKHFEWLSNTKRHDGPTPPINSGEFESWIKAISDSTAANVKAGPTHTIKSGFISAGFSHGTTSSVELGGLRRTDSIPLKVVESWQPQSTYGRPANNAIFDVIWRVLTPADRKSGYIYAFTHHSSPGLRKIGYSKNVLTRQKQWDASCRRHHVYKPLPDDGGVLHARRVEKLIHAELKDFRKRAECDQCKRRHCEWFEVSEEHLEKVFLKWKDWIEQRPYEQDFGDIWRLKSAMIANLKKDCEPLQPEILSSQQSYLLDSTVQQDLKLKSGKEEPKNMERRSGIADTQKAHLRLGPIVEQEEPRASMWYERLKFVWGGNV
jgi:hypothetical protein